MESFSELLAWLKPYLLYFGDYPSLQALFLILLSFLVAKFTDWLLTATIHRLVRKTSNRLDDEITEILHKPLFNSVMLLGLAGATILLKLSAPAQANILAILMSIAILIWMVFVIKLSRSLLRHISARPRPEALIRVQTLPLFENLAFVLSIAVALYMIFSAWNIDMTAWLASAGIVGIAVGFAAKDTLANLFSGVFILADAPYKIGDFVVLDSGERGAITHIGIRSTRLLTRDDIEVTIPNAIMGNTKVINESGGPYEKYRIRVKVGVAYGSDIDQVKDILLDVAKNQEWTCDFPAPRIRFRNFGAAALELELLVWIDQPVLRGRTLDQLNTKIYKRFREQGIEIPYNKQDIYVKEFPSISKAD
jgi:small-conductance mechanosensitive channel